MREMMEEMGLKRKNKKIRIVRRTAKGEERGDGLPPVRLK